MNVFVATLSFLVAIMETQWYSVVVSGFTGLLYPENIGVDIRIALLGASLTNF